MFACTGQVTQGKLGTRWALSPPDGHFALSIFQRVFGSSNERKVRAMMGRVERINALEAATQPAPDGAALALDEALARLHEARAAVAGALRPIEPLLGHGTQSTRTTP